MGGLPPRFERLIGENCGLCAGTAGPMLLEFCHQKQGAEGKVIMQKVVCGLALIFVFSLVSVHGDGLSLDNPGQSLRKPDIWVNDIGGGFVRGAQEIDFSVVDALGIASLVGFHNHDLALAAFHYGWMFGPVGENRCYGGNWELLGESFVGSQYHPNPAYVVGLTALLRYNFATKLRLVPFIDGGAGPTFTDIGLPDLSLTYNFNLQAGIGVHYFWRRNSAFTLESRFFHLSNAGLKYPNDGVNTVSFLFGFSWFF